MVVRIHPRVVESEEYGAPNDTGRITRLYSVSRDAERSANSTVDSPEEIRAPLRVAANQRKPEMIVGYQVIFAAYGFWLPNDPRGSWSDFVGSWDLFRYGPATTTDATHSVAHCPHDAHQREAAKKALRYPPVQFSGVQARAVGRGFARYAEV